MDANNTRFHLMMGRDWAPWRHKLGQEAPVVWDEAQGSVALRPLVFQFKTSPKDVPPTPHDRRGAARDLYGNWYWIAPNRQQVLVRWNAESQAEAYWAAGMGAAALSAAGPGAFGPSQAPAPVTPWTLQGLTITEHHWLVVGVLAPVPGLLFFDLHAGGPPLWQPWPVDFVPWDLAPTRGGGLYILDLVVDTPRYWELDKNFQVCAPPAAGGGGPSEPPPGTFVGPDGQPALPPPAPGVDPISLSHPLLEAADDPTALPTAIAALPDGTLLVLYDTEPARLCRYLGGVRTGTAAMEIPREQLDAPGPGATLALRVHDIAFLPAAEQPPDAVAGGLYAAASDGNQTFLFDLTVTDGKLLLELQPRFLPMHLFGGKGLVQAGDTIWYDFQDQWLPLTEQERPRFTIFGQLILPFFDGKEPDCIWHRVLLDAAIPPGAAVQLETRVSNDPADFGTATTLPWQPEPQPYLRPDGAELPYYEPFGEAERTRPGVGTWESLLQNARGRYLQVRLTLTGTGRNTPRLKTVRIYYPRFSYLRQYLPGAYQFDPTSASLLDRFLANPEGILTALEDRIAQAQVLFDQRTVPDEYLDWLGGWFGLMLDGGWDEARKRLFLAHAMDIFHQRGTVPGLVRAIRLATDPCPDERLFTEDVSDQNLMTRRFAGYQVRLRENGAHHFTVLVPTSTWGRSGAPPIDPTVVSRVVALEKPAHTEFALQEYGAMFQVGAARLGLETVLDRGTRLSALILGQGKLAESYLAYQHPWGVSDRVVVGRDRPGPAFAL